MKKKIISALLAALMLLSLAACGTAQQTAASATVPPAAEQTETPAESTFAIEQIIVGTTAAIETATRDEYAFDMLASGVSEPPLVWQDDVGNYHSLLADYETDDAVTWTFTVIDGMKWSDGEPVTAEDILFTLNYEDSNGSANFVEQTDKDGKVTAARYTGYVISDDGRSISLTLASPNVRMLSNMTSFRVMPQHIYDGKDSVSEDESRVGCGPYIFDSFNKEAGTISFTANPNYPTQPNVGKIVYRLFGNDDTMYMALQNGDIDMVWNYSSGVPAAYQDVLATDTGVAFESLAAANAPAVLAFNNANGPFADENLRKAVSFALNYETFKEYFGSAYAEVPNRGFVPPTTVGYKDTDKLVQNTELAAKYMADAGFIEKNGDGFYINADGDVAGFTLTVNAGKEAHVGYAELIKTQLEEFGIKVELDAIDSDSYNAKTSNKFSENNITMEAAIYGYTAAGMGMMAGLATIYVDGTHTVQGGCQVFDEEFLDIVSEMKAAVNLDDYCAGAAKIQDYYAEHTPLIALYWDSMILAHSAALDNFTIDAVFGLNNINNWYTITAK